jgi:hemoglobin-like flavoprotein
MPESYSDVQASYGRCSRKKGFITRFYQLLLDSDPRMEPMFAHTDWTQQNKALRRGISIALTYAGGSKIVERPLKEMAEVHSRKGSVPVDPALYSFWRQSLIQAVREHDSDLTPALEMRWDSALRKTTGFFVEHY